MYDVVVTGRSLPALQAALDFAEVGLEVAVTAAIDADPGVEEPLRDPEGLIAGFMERVAAPIAGTDADPQAAALPVAVPPATPLLLGKNGGWLPQPQPNLLGIPAVAVASDSIAMLGRRAAARAFLDQVMPLLTVGKTQGLADLVRKRLGAAVLDRMVEPQVFERFGVGAESVDVAVAAPGLNETLTRAGALGSAVLAYADRNVARETRVEPALGWEPLREALLRKLALYDANLLAASVVELRSYEEGWVVALEDGSQLETRAIVADHGRAAVPPRFLATVLESLSPASARVYASTAIERPAWLRGAASALGSFDGWGLRLDSGGRSDAVRAGDAARAGEPGTVRARLASAAAPPEQLPGGANSASAGAADAQCCAELDAVLGAAGFSRSADSEWSVATVAAPFATAEDHASSVEALSSAVQERPAVLPVGSALHGDDLGAALGSAHELAVELRRALLGLTARPEGPEGSDG